MMSFSSDTTVNVNMGQTIAFTHSGYIFRIVSKSAIISIMVFILSKKYPYRTGIEDDLLVYS